MGYRIQLKGRAAVLALVVVLVLWAGNRFVPALLAKTGLTSGYSYRLWNSGYTEHHGGELASVHPMLGSSRGYNLGWFVAGAGDRVIVSYEAEVEAGSFAVYLWRVWGEGSDFNHRIRVSGRDRLTIPVEESGIYSIRLSHFHFKGGYEVSWEVE